MDIITILRLDYRDALLITFYFIVIEAVFKKSDRIFI